MKILQIGEGWFPEEAGGLNRYYYDCVHYLPQAGVEVKGLVAGSSNVLHNSKGQVQAFAPTNASLLQRWRGVRQATQKHLLQGDNAVIVSHFALYTFPCLTQLGHHPLVIHFHGPWALESQMEGGNPMTTWAKKALEQATYRRTARFIVLSTTFREILHKAYHVPLERIHIIPGGTNIEHFDLSLSKVQARLKLGWSLDNPIIFCVRRLAKRMGLENLITAFKQMHEHYPNAILYIAGKGPLASVLQSQIASLKLTHHVKLLGYVPDEQLPIAYRAANFSIVPTIDLEGFGLIVVESLAAGTPVLGTPVGGIPSILQPFCPDLLLDGYTPNQLAQGMIEALTGKRQLPNQEACQAYVQKHYAWSAIAKRIKSVYQLAIDEKKSSTTPVNLTV
jgi:glycosyltransferase involved in cell wall biosynthesis